MRIRSVKPDYFKDEKLAELPPLTRILFQGLWCMADVEGRLEDRPKYIKVEVLPYDSADVEKMLKSLSDGGFIVRYEVESKNYIQVVNFKKHQRISGKEADTKSEFPSMGSNWEATGKQLGSIGDHPESQEGKGREGKGRDSGFQPPTPQEVKDYAKTLPYQLDGEKFVNHYEAAGWMRGKTKIKSWKACVRLWKQNDFEAVKPKGKEVSKPPSFADEKIFGKMVTK